MLVAPYMVPLLLFGNLNLRDQHLEGIRDHKEHLTQLHAGKLRACLVMYSERTQ